MATIGRGAAVVQMLGGRTMTGRKAQVAWGAVHLALLPTNEDRAKAVVDWAGAAFTHQRAGRITRGRRVADRDVAAPRRSTSRASQFATTSIYHFLFVPLTLGLGPLVAVMQTIWHRTRDERWLRLTRFFGTLLLINFAIGVATGLVQEFEFGMNWSVYSQFVGNVFGAPLAIEGLAAFILEATFLGLWIFGWNRLSPRAASGDAVDRRARDVDVGVLHPRRELVDAAPGRVQDRERRGAADERLGAPVERVRAARVRAHDARRA